MQYSYAGIARRCRSCMNMFTLGSLLLHASSSLKGFHQAYVAGKDGGSLHCVPVSPKMPRFSGKGSWEAYRAQFEVLLQLTGQIL